MASPPPRSSSSFFSVLEGFFSALLQPQVRSGCIADAFPSARHEHPNQGIMGVVKTRGSGLQQDSPSPDGQPQHSHECILELNTELRSSPVLILDSGATRHVAGDRSLFTSPFTTVTPVGSAAAAACQACDGRRLAVAGSGTISFKDFHLPNVLYVPDLRTLVIRVSVQQLAEELDYLVMFGGGQCHVKDRSSGKIVGKGRLHDDDALYHLEFLRIPPDTADADAVPQDPV